MRRANTGLPSLASAPTLNSHGGLTKGDRSGKTLNSKGEVQSPNYDSDETNNDSIMTDTSQATVGNDTVKTNDSGNTVGNSTVRSDYTEMRTKGDSTATPKADNCDHRAPDFHKNATDLPLQIGEFSHLNLLF